MKMRYLFTSLLMLTLFACSSSFNNNVTTTVEEELTPDQLLREKAAGTYLVDCYDSGGGSYFTHMISMTKGDISGGAYTHIQRKYQDAECKLIKYTITLNATFYYGAVAAIDLDDEAFSNEILLGAELVDSPKMNITITGEIVNVHDGASVAALEAALGVEIPELDVDVEVPMDPVAFYTHAYYPADFSQITVAPFMPAAIDYRATFEGDGAIVAVKQ